MNLRPYQIKIAVDSGIVLLAVSLGAVGGWYFTSNSADRTEKWTPTQPSPQVQAVPMQEVHPPAVKVYVPRAKQKLQLPAEILQAPGLYVLSSTRLPNDTHPATVTTLIDEKTGEVQTYTRREPLPWLAVESTGEARIDVGIKSITGTVARLTVRQDLLQVKALHAGLNASLDTDGQVFVGVGVGYRW